MANLEIAYELSGLADYLLASPGLVPVEGWPYEKMFEALTGDVAVVDEEVLRPLGRGNEPVALRIVEPLHGSFCHGNTPPLLTHERVRKAQRSADRTRSNRAPR